jgi:hypothetical protein
MHAAYNAALQASKHTYAGIRMLHAWGHACGIRMPACMGMRHADACGLQRRTPGQLTCFTSTKVQILTTSTKVQILTPEELLQASFKPRHAY